MELKKPRDYTRLAQENDTGYKMRDASKTHAKRRTKNLVKICG